MEHARQLRKLSQSSSSGRSSGLTSYLDHVRRPDPVREDFKGEFSLFGSFKSDTPGDFNFESKTILAGESKKINAVIPYPLAFSMSGRTTLVCRMSDSKVLNLPKDSAVVNRERGTITCLHPFPILFTFWETSSANGVEAWFIFEYHIKIKTMCVYTSAVTSSMNSKQLVVKDLGEVVPYVAYDEDAELKSASDAAPFSDKSSVKSNDSKRAKRTQEFLAFEKKQKPLEEVDEVLEAEVEEEQTYRPSSPIYSTYPEAEVQEELANMPKYFPRPPEQVRKDQTNDDVEVQPYVPANVVEPEEQPFENIRFQDGQFFFKPMFHGWTPKENRVW